MRGAIHLLPDTPSKRDARLENTAATLSFPLPSSGITGDALVHFFPFPSVCVILDFDAK
jgi:hypothetical protein